MNYGGVASYYIYISILVRVETFYFINKAVWISRQSTMDHKDDWPLFHTMNLQEFSTDSHFELPHAFWHVTENLNLL